MRVRKPGQEDYLLRVIREAAEALRRLREMLTDTEQSAAPVRAELASTIAVLLGPEAPLLQQLDADTAVRLLNDERVLALWIEALELQANALEADDSPTDAIRHRADNLRAAGARLEALQQTRE